jgi:hypothetical protein
MVSQQEERAIKARSAKRPKQSSRSLFLELNTL